MRVGSAYGPTCVQWTCRALVVIFDDEDARVDGARLSDTALAQDWARPEEDDAWAPLQPAT